jgi:tetratricopeptide (TPR) repeat protein
MIARSSARRASGPAGHGLFLSYNSVDRDAVLKVRAALEQRAAATFLDRRDLTPGLPWITGLEDALRRVKAVAVFVGSGGMGAWQKREMQVAIDHQAHEEEAGRAFPVIPVLLPLAETATAPAFLLLNTWIDLRHRLDDVPALDLLAATSRGVAPAAAPAEAAIFCPYRGLQAFREEDAALFFGREGFAAQLAQKLSERKLVVVAGASGSGKSSVVQAGLLPLLRQQRAPTWEAVICTPSDRPFQRLAAGLVGTWAMEKSKVERLVETEQLGARLRDGAVSLRAAVDLALAESPGIDRLLLVVDQFEELFTLTAEAERQAFVASLLDATRSSAVSLILVLRADFYGPAIGLSRGLSDGIQEGVINVGPMTRDELRLTIEKPAAAAQLQFELGLVDRILDHVEKQPGTLPLLEFALTELFGDGTTRVVTHAAYNDIGGVEGAVAKRAETVFGRLNADQQRIAIATLSRLVRVAGANEEGTDTRRRVRQSELDPASQAVLSAFAEARLLVTGRHESSHEQTVEIAHEALLRHWTRLADWVDKDREFLLWRQRVSLLLAEWEQSERDPGLLLRRAQLSDAVRWLNDREPDITERERGFIRHSLRENAESRRLPAWQAARDIADPLSRTLALEDVVEALAGSEPDQARLAAAEALDAARNVPEPALSRALFSAVKAFAKARDTQTAIAVARTIPDPNRRSAALANLAEELVRAGDADHALRIAEELESPFDVGELARELVTVGRFRDILKVARAFADPEKRLRAETRVAEALAKAGLVDDALGIANELSEPYTFAVVAAAMAQGERVADLLHAAATVPNVRQRERAFGNIAEEFVRLERLDTFRAAAAVFHDTSSHSLILAGLARALAKAGRHQEAVDTARMIRNLETQSQALVFIAEVTAGHGRTADAVVLAAGLLPKDQRSAFTWIAETLIKQGQGGQLRQTVEAIADERVRSSALAGFARALAKTGNIEQALALATTIEDPDVFATLTQTSSASGGLAAILDAAGAQSTSEAQRAAFRAIAGELVYLGDTGELEALAPRIADESTRHLALGEVAVALARSGRTESAAAIAREIADPRKRSDTAARIAEALLALGRFDEAARAARETTDSDAIGHVAEALAQAGRMDESAALAATISHPYALADLAEAFTRAGRAGDLLAAATSLPDAERRHAALRMIATRGSELGTLEALGRAAAVLPGPDARSLALGHIAVQIGRNAGAPAGMAVARAIPSRTERTSTFSLLAEVAAERGDFAAAIEVAGQIPSADRLHSTFAAIAAICFDNNTFDQLLKAVDEARGAALRSSAMSGLAHGLCDAGVHEAAMLVALAIPDDEALRRVYARCVAAGADAAAFDRMWTLTNTEDDAAVRERGQERLLSAMVSVGEKETAIRLSRTLQDPVVGFRVLGPSLAGAGHLREALEMAVALEPPERGRAVPSIVERSVNGAGVESAIAFARDLEDASGRALLLRELAQAVQSFSADMARQIRGQSPTPASKPVRRTKRNATSR